jgi:hypothetical protein
VGGNTSIIGTLVLANEAGGPLRSIEHTSYGSMERRPRKPAYIRCMNDLFGDPCPVQSCCLHRELSHLRTILWQSSRCIENNIVSLSASTLFTFLAVRTRIAMSCKSFLFSLVTMRQALWLPPPQSLFGLGTGIKA